MLRVNGWEEEIARNHRWGPVKVNIVFRIGTWKVCGIERIERRQINNNVENKILLSKERVCDRMNCGRKHEMI